MSQVCDVCGKRPVVGNTVSHSHKMNKRRFLPNLKKVKAVVNGKEKYLKACTRCLKSGKVIKAV